MNLRVGLLLCVVMLTLVVPLLSACHSLPVKPCAEPSIPMPPALSQPLPSQPYSSSAQRDAESWLKSLTDTLTTSKP